MDVRVSLQPDLWLTVPETEALEFSRWGILLESIPSIGMPVRHTEDFITTKDSTALVDASSGAVTATLHVGRAGDTVTVVNVGASGTVTVTAPDGYPGGSDVILTSQWESIDLRCYEPGSWLSST